MTEEGRLKFELSEMAAPTFTISVEDIQVMATESLNYWYDASEYEGEQSHDPTHETEPMRSGICWQLLPREYRIIRSCTATECKGCSMTITDNHLVLIGTNHLGVPYLLHVEAILADVLQKCEYIGKDDYTVTYAPYCPYCLSEEDVDQVIQNREVTV